jgi:DNA replication protein DnaC
VQSIKETWERGAAKKEAHALRDLVEPDLLILDEVGVQFGSDTEKLILFDIINGRYEASRPTIVISNLAVPELEGYLGVRAFDRLREGGGRLVACNWASYRARRAT